MDIKCGNCCWWDGEGEAVGTCRRHAPSPLTQIDSPLTNEDINVLVVFPTMFENDWCGEFQDKTFLGEKLA